MPGMLISIRATSGVNDSTIESAFARPLADNGQPHHDFRTLVLAGARDGDCAIVSGDQMLHESQSDSQSTFCMLPC